MTRETWSQTSEEGAPPRMRVTTVSTSCAGAPVVALFVGWQFVGNVILRSVVSKRMQLIKIEPCVLRMKRNTSK